MNAEPAASPGQPRAEDDQPGPGPGTQRWIVDALERTPGGLVARLELPDGTTCDLPLSSLPQGLQEGEVLTLQDGPDGVIARRLPAATRARRTAAQAQLDALNAGETTEGAAASDTSDEIRL